MDQHDTRHVDVSIESLGLENGNTVQIPIVDDVKDENPVHLDPEQISKYRSHVARCLFLSQDRADNIRRERALPLSLSLSSGLAMPFFCCRRLGHCQDIVFRVPCPCRLCAAVFRIRFTCAPLVSRQCLVQHFLIFPFDFLCFFSCFSCLFFCTWLWTAQVL